MQRREFLIGTTALTAASSVPARALSQERDKDPGTVAKPMKILVLGGTRFLGPTVVRSALANGHAVTMFNRGVSNPWLFRGVDRRIGNRFSEQEPGLSALKEGRWDLVIDISAQYPRHVMEAARLLADKTDHYLMMSSIAVYGDYRRTGINEDSSVLENPPAFQELPDLFETDWHHYGWRKVLCERAVQQVFGSRCAIIRAGQLIGQSLGGENRSDGRWYWPARLTRDSTIAAPGNGSDPVQPVDVRDLADFLLRTGRQKLRGTFNVVGPSIPFGRYIEAARSVVNSNAELRWLGSERSRRLYNIPYFTPQVTMPGFGTIANARAVNAGMKFRPVEESIRTDWQFFLENMPRNYDFAANGTGLTPQREAELLRQS